MSDNRDWQADMTREEILAMEPGWRMDVEIAQIMGWEGEADERPAYSTDISAAWELLENLEKEVTVKRYEAMAGFRYWCRITGNDPERFDETIAHGRTAAEAICKAALLTVMDKEAEA